MKTLIITASLIASVLTGAISANAAERFDGAKFFSDVASRSSNH